MYTLVDGTGTVIAKWPDMQDLGSILESIKAAAEKAEEIRRTLQQLTDDGK